MIPAVVGCWPRDDLGRDLEVAEVAQQLHQEENLRREVLRVLNASPPVRHSRITTTGIRYK